MQTFEVAAGQALDGVTVSLRKGGVIAGRVLDSFGQPMRGRERDGVIETSQLSWPADRPNLGRRTAAHAIRPGSDERPR